MIKGKSIVLVLNDLVIAEAVAEQMVPLIMIVLGLLFYLAACCLMCTFRAIYCVHYWE